MLVSADCPDCATTVEKDIRMMPHFMTYRAECPNCGFPVRLKYRPGYESQQGHRQ